MAVSTQHPEFKRMLPQWEKCRDVFAGTDQMRAKTTDYLPMLTDESSEAYQARLNRAVLYNAFFRTISGMVGLLFRVPAVLEAPEYTTSLTEDVTMTGTPLTVLAQEIAEECLVVGRVGLYVNYPIADTATMTQADAIAYNLRPSLSIIKAEQIINWKQRRVNNKYVLSMAVVEEEFLIPENEFKDKAVTRYRVLDLDESDTYRVRIMSEDEKGNDVLIEGPYYPMMGGKAMDFIPLVIIGPDNIDPVIDDPLMVDLCDLNINHFQFYADLAQGAHFSGLPTPVITGHEMKEGEKLHVGPGKALVLPNPAAKAVMLEVGTAGFVALEKLLNRLESQMISVGSKSLENTRLQAESQETAMLYRGGENSILASAAIAMGTGITIAMKVFARWAGDDHENVRFTINKEFFKEQVSSDMLRALVESWQNGAISAEAKFKYLQTHEMYPPEITFDEEEQRIKDGMPKEPAKRPVLTTIRRNDDGSMTAERASA